MNPGCNEPDHPADHGEYDCTTDLAGCAIEGRASLAQKHEVGAGLINVSRSVNPHPCRAEFGTYRRPYNGHKLVFCHG